MSEKIKLRPTDTMLVMVKDGVVVHFTPNMGLPHSEFVKRTVGELPEGAWVGTVSKLGKEVAAISSKYFFGQSIFRKAVAVWSDGGRSGLFESGLRCCSVTGFI